jgi:hypothetical protein
MCSLAGGGRGFLLVPLKIVMWMIEFVFASEQSDYSRVTGYPEVKPQNKRSTRLARSRLVGRDHPSGVFQSEIVVHGLAKFLLATEIPLGCQDRCVSK